MHSTVAHNFTYMSSAALPSSFLIFSVESDVQSDSMDSKASADPMFVRVLKKQSSEAQEHLHENGLLDPGVYEIFLGDPDTRVEELAFETGDISMLQELLGHAQRAARGQRAEFARREQTSSSVETGRDVRKPDSTKPTVPPSCKERSSVAQPALSLSTGTKHKAGG